MDESIPLNLGIRGPAASDCTDCYCCGRIRQEEKRCRVDSVTEACRGICPWLLLFPGSYVTQILLDVKLCNVGSDLCGKDGHEKCLLAVVWRCWWAWGEVVTDRRVRWIGVDLYASVAACRELLHCGRRL